MRLHCSLIVGSSFIVACAGAAAAPPQVPVAQPTAGETSPPTAAAELAAPNTSEAVPTSPTMPSPVAAPAVPVAATESAATTAATPTVPSAVFALSGTVTTMPPKSAASAVVYIENAPLPQQPVNETVDNKQMTFVPTVAVITVGGKVKFSNHDPFPHNVFSPDNERFDIGQVPPHGNKSKTFTKPGVYTLLCNIHPNMKSYLVVSPTGYFARADKDGSYSIASVPAGTYNVTAWAPAVKPATQSVTVSANVTADFDLKRK